MFLSYLLSWWEVLFCLCLPVVTFLAYEHVCRREELLAPLTNSERIPKVGTGADHLSGGGDDEESVEEFEVEPSDTEELPVLKESQPVPQPTPSLAQPQEKTDRKKNKREKKAAAQPASKKAAAPANWNDEESVEEFEVEPSDTEELPVLKESQPVPQPTPSLAQPQEKTDRKKNKREKKAAAQPASKKAAAPANWNDEESVEEFEVEPSDTEELPVLKESQPVPQPTPSLAQPQEKTDRKKNKRKKKAAAQPASKKVAAPANWDDEESAEEFEVEPSDDETNACNGDSAPNLRTPTIAIAYATNTRTALSLAHKLFNSISSALAARRVDSLSGSSEAAPVVPVVRVMEINEEAAMGFTSTSLLEDKQIVCIIYIVSTFTEGKAPPASQSFESLVQDAFTDHRIPRTVLESKRFALLGLGDLSYGAENFNRFGKNLVAWCRGLGAPNFAVPPVYASERRVEMLFKTFTVSLLAWLNRTEFYNDGSVHTQRPKRMKKKGDECCCKEASTGDGPPVPCGSDEDSNVSEESLEDMEDAVWGGDEPDEDPENPPELLYPKLRENLTKQGYRLIGSHSGVKLCRWTKSMLRGRGGCYKHTFYNINSSQCMEMTPSLACANKCVFCWRHHTNPVSRHFRWKQDPPELLLDKGMEFHYSMIKQMKGVPGVTPERLQDAMNIRHCALSLVGEPIMYPQINGFCDLLHERHISSFMVTNAQFPDQLRDLKPVVQLYLSIDAATPEELKRIDRPLFENYWERCVQCVQELKRKKQRTVFRLTLVNQYNAENIAAYADLVMQGWPDFIEVKGVTYCGTSTSSTLTMKENVPRHDEVIRFCTGLCEEIARRHPNYQTPHMINSSWIPNKEQNQPYHIACEHEHSCCVLIALDKFFINGQWHTWIDYDKFYELVESGKQDFTSLDYALATPSWAVYRSPEAGFDPEHVRVTRGRPRPVGPQRE